MINLNTHLCFSPLSPKSQAQNQASFCLTCDLVRLQRVLVFGTAPFQQATLSTTDSINIYIFFQIRHFQNTDNDECKCCHKISAHLLPGLYRIQFTMELTQEHRDSVATPERKTPTVGEKETIRKTFSLSENKKKKTISYDTKSRHVEWD